MLTPEEQEPAPQSATVRSDAAEYRDHSLPDEPGWEHPRGTFIQRSMSLLANSAPERRNRARVVVYGQSIMGGDWSERIREYLVETFPHADIEYENLAMGGYAAARLNQTAEHDIYPDPPDLMIFHVFGGFGGSGDYERIISETRHRTTAEIAIVTDHLHRDTFLPTRAPTEAHRDLVSYERIPDICRRYGCELIEIRRPWRAYLKEHDLQPGDLLRDGIHLNERGGWLMAQLINRHLVYLPEQEAVDRETVRDYVVGRDVDWVDGRLQLDWFGNRIEAVFRRERALAAEGDSGSVAAEAWIDGAPPSVFPGAWRKTRASGYRDISGWPVLCRVDHDVPLVEEDWTLTFLEVDRSEPWPAIRYRVEGSRTGFDGEGSNLEIFVSDSGRAIIHPRNFAFLDNFRAESSLTPGFQVRWRTEPNHRDRLALPDLKELKPGEERIVVLASDVGNQPHRLELALDSGQRFLPGLVALRVHRPPFLGDAEAKIDKRPVEVPSEDVAQP